MQFNICYVMCNHHISVRHIKKKVMCLNFSFTFLLSSPIRCDRNLAGPLSGRYICFPGSSSTKHGLAHHNSQHSELKEWVKEKEGERERLSAISVRHASLKATSPFSPLLSLLRLLLLSSKKQREKKRRKKRKKVWLSAHHAATLSSSPQRRVAVQAWKCSRLRRHECTQKGSLQQIRWRLIPASMWSINQQSRTNKL